MKLYKTTCTDHAGRPVKPAIWNGTQVDARETRQAYKAVGVAETKEVDVPTDKAGLLTWLNENCSGE